VTDELAIKVYVESKKALSRVTEADKIPLIVEGVKTDVVEVGRIRFQGPRDKNRPTQGGDSAGSCHSLTYGYIMAGTLGVALIDRTDGKEVMLSNNHVFADMDSTTEHRATAGDPIVQPGTLDGGSAVTDVIGHLKRWIPFNMAGSNEVDAAIADLNNAADATECTVGGGIGRVNGSRTLSDADYDLPVQKYGRTTFYTTGTVIDTDAIINVNYEVLTAAGIVVRTIHFVNQILLTGMSDAGDSGSLILDMDEKAVGLLFAGSSTVTVANRIELVLDRLNLEFCPSPPICARPGTPLRPLCNRITGPIVQVCLRIGSPDNIIRCARIGTPDSVINCRTGAPLTPWECRIGSPNTIMTCTSNGPDHVVSCGTGGPDNWFDVIGCAAGPNIDINFKDPKVNPSKIAIINVDKIPADMRASFEKMMKKMAEAP